MPKKNIRAEVTMFLRELVLDEECSPSQLRSIVKEYFDNAVGTCDECGVEIWMSEEGCGEELCRACWQAAREADRDDDRSPDSCDVADSDGF